jgi:hypothetical protein
MATGAERRFVSFCKGVRRYEVANENKGKENKADERLALCMETNSRQGRERL